MDAETPQGGSSGHDWRPVPGWVHRYLVSDDGRVWSVRRATMLTPHVNEDGYERVYLKAPDRRWNAYVHHVVLRAYEGPRPEGFLAHHINHDSRDNRAENLRWVDKEIHHAYHNSAPDPEEDPAALPEEERMSGDLAPTDAPF